MITAWLCAITGDEMARYNGLARVKPSAWSIRPDIVTRQHLPVHQGQSQTYTNKIIHPIPTILVIMALDEYHGSLNLSATTSPTRQRVPVETELADDVLWDIRMDRLFGVAFSRLKQPVKLFGIKLLKNTRFSVKPPF